MTRNRSKTTVVSSRIPTELADLAFRMAKVYGLTVADLIRKGLPLAMEDLVTCRPDRRPDGPKLREVSLK